MLTAEFNGAGIEAHYAQLQAKVGAAIRPAAQAGAQVLYDEVRLRAPRSDKPHSTKGKRITFQPGNLQRAIYQAYAADQSRDGAVAVYNISWNKSKAFYGRFVERGTSRQPARSFLRASYDAKRAEAVGEVQRLLRDHLKGAL